MGIQEDGKKQASIEKEPRMELMNDLPRGKFFIIGIGLGQVEIALVERRLGRELRAISEDFQIKEFILDEQFNPLV